MDNQKVWFITGASQGLGPSLVKQALEKGDRVVAVLPALTGNEEDSTNFLSLAPDLNDEIDVELAVDQAIDRFGRLDVIVNNAGYRSAGMTEEWTQEEERENFFTNIFGALNVIQQALPQLREQGSGHIINISSIPGFLGSLASEEAAAGIRVSHYRGGPDGPSTPDTEAAAILRLVQGCPARSHFSNTKSILPTQNFPLTFYSNTD